jgi:hypothetical protein
MLDRRRLDDPSQWAEIEHELGHRSCRRELTAFAEHAPAPKGETPARHHRRFCAEPQAVARGEVPLLVVLVLRKFEACPSSAWFTSRGPSPLQQTSAVVHMCLRILPRIPLASPVEQVASSNSPIFGWMPRFCLN